MSSHSVPPLSDDTTVTETDPRADDPPPEAAVPSDHGWQPLKLVFGIVGIAVTVWALGNLFLAFAFYPGWFFDSKILMFQNIATAVASERTKR